MKPFNQRFHTVLLTLACGLTGIGTGSIGHAQESYPSRLVTMVVPVAAGGVTDRTARLIARSLAARWKQPVTVDNKPGASSNIGTALVAKAAPDGYTLLVSGGPFSINPSLFSSLPFDTVKAFAPVAQLISFSAVLLAHPSFPAKNMDEFLALARRPGNPVTYASAGNGSAQHLTMELLRAGSKLSLNHVPYKGGAPAINDLLGGHVPTLMIGMGEASAFLGTDRVRPLVTTGRTRSPLTPNVPTLQELGLLEFETSGWAGLHAPAGTPADIITKINADVAAVLAEPGIKQALAAMDVEARPGSVNDFRLFVESQMAKWKEAVALSGAKAD